jgi:plasmid stabilization system protein ParE
VAATFRVEITPTAERDIEAAWDYIAQEGPESATAFIDALERQFDTLESFPARCPLISENEILGTDFRHLLHGNYRTIFRITGKTVVILRVIHGARLLDESMFDG